MEAAERAEDGLCGHGFAAGVAGVGAGGLLHGLRVGWWGQCFVDQVGIGVVVERFDFGLWDGDRLATGGALAGAAGEFISDLDFLTALTGESDGHGNPLVNRAC